MLFSMHNCLGCPEILPRLIEVMALEMDRCKIIVHGGIFGIQVGAFFQIGERLFFPAELHPGHGHVEDALAEAGILCKRRFEPVLFFENGGTGLIDL